MKIENQQNQFKWVGIDLKNDLGESGGSNQIKQTNHEIREYQMKEIRAKNIYINDNDETIENNSIKKS